MLVRHVLAIFPEVPHHRKKFIVISGIALLIVIAILISGRYDISTIGFDVASNGQDFSIKTEEKISDV